MKEYQSQIRDCKIGKNVIFEDINKTIIKNCTIGNNVFIGAYTKLINVNIKDNTKIFSFVNLYGPNLNIGKNCKIGSFVEIQKDVKIGNFCIISSHSFLCSGVILRGNNFIGHHCCFTNDRKPKAFNNNYILEKTIIQKGANIGSGTRLLPVIIGENSLIGMGSIVVTNIPSNCIAISKKAKAEIINNKIKKLLGK
jgi:acetyltransferase-like isoleucine patch superfamily enzyme